jgi:hypothetical protein
MRSHFFSVHPSIWDIVEDGMQIPDSDDENYNIVEVEEIIHRNSQATIGLLASPSREECNKVNGLENAKDIWDTLKTTHEGNMMTKIIKMELNKGELRRFTINRGEGLQEMYNMLKCLVNQDPIIVYLILENPRYTKMVPEEVLCKFVSHQMTVKDAKNIDDVANRSNPSTKSQTISFKEINEKKVIPSKMVQVEVVGLNDEEMALIIKCFKNALKGRKDYNNKSKGKHAYFKCGKTGHFIANCLDNNDVQDKDKKGEKVEKKFYRKKKGEAHIDEEWDSDCSSSDPDDEGLTIIAFNKSSLFPKVHHTCLMAKEKNVLSRDTRKHTSSSDDSSDDEKDYRKLFMVLDKYKINKINELVNSINEKNELIEKIKIVHKWGFKS